MFNQQKLADLGGMRYERAAIVQAGHFQLIEEDLKEVLEPGTPTVTPTTTTRDAHHEPSASKLISRFSFSLWVRCSSIQENSPTIPPPCPRSCPPKRGISLDAVAISILAITTLVCCVDDASWCSSKSAAAWHGTDCSILLNLELYADCRDEVLSVWLVGHCNRCKTNRQLLQEGYWAQIVQERTKHPPKFCHIPLLN